MEMIVIISVRLNLRAFDERSENYLCFARCLRDSWKRFCESCLLIWCLFQHMHTSKN